MERTWKYLEKGYEAHKSSKGGRIMLEAQLKPTSNPIRSPGPGRTKTDAQIASGLRFGCSTYVWKAEKTTFPMALVPCQNSF